MEYEIRPRNFRIRSRIYSRNGYYPRYWDVQGSNLSEVNQSIANFGQQTNVTQSSVVNQSIGIDKKP